MRIREISPENRPRERLAKLGSSALSDAELLAIILKTGNKEENAIDISNRLISKYGLDKLSTCSLIELQSIKGIGKAKSSQILASFELSKRSKISQNKEINCSKDVFAIYHSRLSELDREIFMVLHLDTRNQLINDEIISIGTLNEAIIHPREVFKSAIKQSANSVILVHNHPSGDPSPSPEDEEITRIIREAGDLLKIKVLDHIIIGKNKFYSFTEDKGLNP
ncbi:DNA repair protein RadC [Candidatus Woesearchaeota archaeon]|nr:DNA repair protein RadC [Candidatus Woesearchaeota archaeon]